MPIKSAPASIAPTEFGFIMYFDQAIDPDLGCHGLESVQFGIAQSAATIKSTASAPASAA